MTATRTVPVLWAIFSTLVLVSCSAEAGTDSALIDHTQNGVRVTVDLVGDATSGFALEATFTPEQDSMHMFDEDLPLDGLDGLGRPTRIDLVGGDAISRGEVTADLSPTNLIARPAGEPLPTYPDGPVILRLPIEFTQPSGPGADFDLSVSITYMSCDSHGGCKPPVEGLKFDVTVPSGHIDLN